MRSYLLMSQSRFMIAALSVLASGPAFANCTDRQLAESLFSLDRNEKFDAASRLSDHGIGIRDISEETGCFRVFRNWKLTVPRIDLLTQAIGKIPARLKSQLCFEYFEKGDPHQFLVDEYLRDRPSGLVVLQARYKVLPDDKFSNSSYAKFIEILSDELKEDSSIRRDLAILIEDWNSRSNRLLEVKFRTIQPSGRVDSYLVKIVNAENSNVRATSHFIRALLNQEKLVKDSVMLKKEVSATKNFIKKAADSYGKSISPRDKVGRRWLASLRQSYQELSGLENVRDLSELDRFVALYNAKANFIVSVDGLLTQSRNIQIRPDAKSFHRVQSSRGTSYDWEDSYWDFYMYPMFYGQPYRGGILQRWYWLMDDVSWSARSAYDQVPYTRIEDSVGNVSATGDNAAKLFTPTDSGNVHVWDDPNSNLIWRNPDASETALDRDSLDGDEIRDFNDATDPTDPDGNWDDVTDDNVNDDRDSDTSFESDPSDNNNDSGWGSSDDSWTSSDSGSDSGGWTSD